MIEQKKDLSKPAERADSPRLIEQAFPLKQASIDSVHEKNVRHGHISTLHIWPARRPLAACRAALIATLLPDPGTSEGRKELIEKIGGIIVQGTKKKQLASGKTEEKIVEETEGGILHWGRETENKDTLDWFRREIRKAYGERAPRVLDPFAGGGAIPLEAMRLGCEVTAVDLNAVAWFILKCTLEYPQKLAGQKRPLPSFVLKDRDFMESFLEYQGFKKASLRAQLERLGFGKSHDPQLPMVGNAADPLEADLPWHVRAWGWWVLNQARKELASFHPTYAEFEPIENLPGMKWEERSRIKVPVQGDGTLDLNSLNAEFSSDYLSQKKNPRWIAKPTIAYHWARTVICKNCNALIPLLKTRWLCKTAKKRVALTIEANAKKSGINFGVITNVPSIGGNAVQRRENDKKAGQGTMSRSGAWCPCCGKPGTVAMTMEDIRQEGLSDRIGTIMTAISVDGPRGKEYRVASQEDMDQVNNAKGVAQQYLSELKHISIDELMRPASTRSISCHLYGIRTYRDLFTPRQLIGLGVIGRWIHSSAKCLEEQGYSENWKDAISAFLAISFDRLLSFSCVNVRWKIGAEAVVDAFSRFSISLLWDFAEPQPIGANAGSWLLCYERIATALETYRRFPWESRTPTVIKASATSLGAMDEKYDVIITDPPYYQAISYSDLSDFFYVWLRGVIPSYPAEFSEPLTSKDSEIVQHIRHDKDREVEKRKYEEGMYAAFSSAYQNLAANGRFVCVFAHKHPAAWETLVSAIIRAGFVVEASWPIQTEMQTRQRAADSASLASSVWLVCAKRSEIAKPGWDNNVLDEMREKIHTRLRDFWDAGIRGPDFVWAATGPALEAYSKHPIVKKADEPGQILTVPEFLRSVRRIVVDFVVGRVLSHNGDTQEVSGLDDVTTYYLLHRHDFGMVDAPIGACILYAISCGLSDSALVDQFDILVRTGGQGTPEEEDEEEAIGGEETAEIEEGTGSKVKLMPWNQRKRASIGYEAPNGRTVPLIDQIHRIMHLWKSGDVIKVDEYLDSCGLRRNALFHQLLQALIELATTGSEERSLLESISNHVASRGVAAEKLQRDMFERT